MNTEAGLQVKNAVIRLNNTFDAAQRDLTIAEAELRGADKIADIATAAFAKYELRLDAMTKVNQDMRTELEAVRSKLKTYEAIEKAKKNSELQRG